MDLSLIGWIASGLNAIGLIPQVYDALKTRRAKDVSFSTFLILVIANVFWLLYGIHLKDGPLIITNLLQFIFGVWILYLKKKYN